MKLSIIIPVYNEQATVLEVVDLIRNVALPEGLDREIIIVDDGSRDHSPRLIQGLGKRHGDIIKAHTSLINLGKGAAVRLGLEFASGEIVLIQDADLELNPEEYPQLLNPILEGRTDVVYGSRFKNKSSHIPLKTRLANRFLVFLTNLLYGSRLTDMATAYKVFRRSAIKNFRLRSAGFEIEPELTSRFLLAGHKIVEVPIRYRPRTELEGKKIGWLDGIKYIYALVRYRFFSKET